MRANSSIGLFGWPRAARKPRFIASVRQEKRAEEDCFRRGPRLDISSETGGKKLGSLVKPGYCRTGRYTGDQNHGVSILGPERSRAACLAGPEARCPLTREGKRASPKNSFSRPIFWSPKLDHFFRCLGPKRPFQWRPFPTHPHGMGGGVGNVWEGGDTPLLVPFRPWSIFALYLSTTKTTQVHKMLDLW